MEIRRAQTEEEVKAAVELSCKYFPISYSEAKQLKDAMCEYLPEDFRSGCFIVAIDHGRIAALLRYYLRRMVIEGVDFPVVGLSDYCVDQPYLGKTLFGVRFYMECLSILRKLRYPLALGSARRIMSNYYYRFGHVSSDCYCRCKIEKLQLSRQTPKDLQFIEGFNGENIEAYESFRREAFSSEWGMIIRTREFWQWIGHQVADLGKHRFFEIRDGSDVVGYFIITGDSFIDYGLSTANFENYAPAMMSFLAELIPISRLVLNLSPANRVFQSLGLSNISYSMRYVPDEGIISLCLDREMLIEVFCKILENVRTKYVLGWDEFRIGDNLHFVNSGNKVSASFDPGKISRKDEQIVLNSLFSGTYGPFSLLNYSGPGAIPPTFFRINDLDAM